MNLTREYFENHPQWHTQYESAQDNFELWIAILHHECSEYGADDHTGLVDISVTNCMYDWRFALSGEINGAEEGYFSGTFFACTVEELEEFFKLCHFDSYKYLN